MITCEFCGTQQEQHDHWRHEIMARVAALEDVVTREPEPPADAEQYSPKEEPNPATPDRYETDGTPAGEAARLRGTSASGVAGEGLVPPGWKLAPGWRVDSDAPDSDTCMHIDADGAFDCLTHVLFGRADDENAGACAAHAVEMGALVKDEPPAEQPSRQETGGDCGVPGCHACTAMRDRAKAKAAESPAAAAGTLSEEAALMGHQQAALLRRIDELHAKLAQAERERDEWQERHKQQRKAIVTSQDQSNERGRQVEQMAAHVATMRVERDEARDCGQEGEVCKVPPGCQHHWELRARELLRERNEAAARERERCLAWAQADIDNGEIATAINNGAPAPKCDPDPPREVAPDRTQAGRVRCDGRCPDLYGRHRDECPLACVNR